MTSPVVKGLALPGYAELFAQSNFSFQHGASHPEELVVRAHALGYQALALTDECSVAGVVRAHTQAQQSGLQLLPGAVFRLQAMRGQPSTAVQKPSLLECPNVSGMADGWRMVVLPRHLGGWGQLCQYITAARGAGGPVPAGGGGAQTGAHHLVHIGHGAAG